MAVAMDAMAVAIHIKYALNQKRYLTSYYDIIQGTLSGKRKRERLGSIIHWTHMDLERLLRVADNRNQWEGRLRSNSI